MKSPALALMATIGALFVAQPALAAAIDVSYEDLDLTTEAGKKELDQRIDRAAKQVCGLNEKTVGTRIPDREAKKCIKQAHRDIAKQLATLTNKMTAGS